MLNKIMLIGNLGRNPEMSYTDNGTAVTRFSLAVSRTYKTPSGEKREETEWFNVVAWRSLAERCYQYLRKGSKVYVEGRVSQRKYTDKNGIERTAFDVIATDLRFLSPKPQEADVSDEFPTDSSDFLEDLDDTQPF
ncbi:single-stranded DNA-binding protein [Thermogemmatispora sp.]|jgi:single-strand DNA-binding protein|uniref:single-stranded DNA-binding protein n=1 Tax=Thermogemmatispora sp. TaxID=1968838 RepID=UPI0035E3FF4C